MAQRILLIQSDVDDALALRRRLLELPDARVEIEWLEDCAQGERRLGIAPSKTVAGVTGILTDLLLSDSQGIDTVDRLLHAAAGVPILLVCSSQQESIAKLAIQRGVHDYLLKGQFDDTMLAKALRSMDGRTASTHALFKEKERVQAVLNSIGDAVISVDVRGDVTDLNAVAESLTGWSRKEAVGHAFERVLPIVDATTRESVLSPLAAAMLTNATVTLPQNCVFVRRDGVEIAIEDSTAPISDRYGRLAGAVMVFRDVSAARAHAQRLSHLARHDSLTDLPNSTLFDDRLTQAMASADRRGHKLSLIFLDMDGFKLVNDSLGHLVGDDLLRSIAQRLLSCVRVTDTVSRRGGDEFIILLPEVAQADDAGTCAEKILAALREPHCIGQHQVNVTASMGIATYPDDGIDAETLLRNADFAMYYAKSRGRNCYQFFRSVLSIPTRGRPVVESERSQPPPGMNSSCRTSRRSIDPIWLLEPISKFGATNPCLYLKRIFKIAVNTSI